MARVRTSVDLEDAQVSRFKKSAEGKKPWRGWTVEMVLLAEAQLDAQDAAEKRRAARQPVDAA